MIDPEFAAVIFVVLVVAVLAIVEFLSWTKTEATVAVLLGCTPRMTFDAPKCSFRVRYTVNGKEYLSLLTTSREFQEREKLEVGSKVTIYYKNKKPGEVSHIK